MSSKSKRRPPRPRRIRPHEQAKVDQAMAAARDRAAREPNAIVFVAEYAEPGLQCCWCDCPVEEHKTPGYRCSGCPEDAVYRIHKMPQKTGDTVYPMCHRHRGGLVQMWQDAAVEARGHHLPIEVYGYDAYDEAAP